LPPLDIPISDPILTFTILVLVMLLAPVLAERLRVPDLALLLGAGALLGPNGLGLLARTTAVTMFGGVGLLYIMFLAGLEIDLDRFARTRRRSVLFGLLTFAIPQGLGMLAARYVLGFGWPTSILLASMFASHTLLAYPLASRVGIARTEPVAVSVGATILTDTLALLVLAVVADSARNMELGVAFWAGLAVGMAALIALTWWGIPHLARWFFEHVTEAGSAQFLFVLAVVCLCAYLSHFAKMEPIIGAFLAGAAFNRLIPPHSVLMSRIVFTGNTLFIPFFLISVGMLVDTRAMAADANGWLVAGVMVVAVITTKYAAAAVAGRLFGYGADSRRVMFGLSVVQAAATLAAVLVGYELGIFGDAVLNGAILMIMVTCPLGSWFVDRYGRRMAASIGVPEAASDGRQRIVVAIKSPEMAARLLDTAFLLRDTSSPGSIHPVTIVRDEGNVDQAVAGGERLLAHCLARASAADIPVDPSVRVDFNASDGILRAARELRASLVLVGWGGRQSLGSQLFGTVKTNLLDDCPSRLTFCRLVRPLNTSSRLIVPMPALVERRQDLSAFLRDVKFLSRQIGATIRVYLPTRQMSALRQAVESARPSRPVEIVEAESPADMRSRLFHDIGPGDTVFFPAERRHSPLWTPLWDGLPQRLAERFPENNLLVAYPPLVEAGEMPAAQPETQTDTAPPLRLAAVDLPPQTTLHDALAQMAEAAFGGRPDLVSRVQDLLQVSAASYPVELAPGTVLLHAHSEGLQAPLLIVARAATPVAGGGAWTAPLRILALLSPIDQAPEVHLKALAQVARRFHDAAFVARAEAAASAEDLCALLGAAEGP